MTEADRKSFNYEEGQFICHIFATISDEEKLVIDEVTRHVLEQQGISKDSRSHQGWTSLEEDNPVKEKPSLHITLLRGHRAIYYHQIKSLVDALVLECKSIAPFCLCLDDLRVFHNFEKTRQFLCLSSRENIPPQLKQLKLKVRQRIDQFATKLTSEDETDDTLPHCSFMSRVEEVCDDKKLVEDLNNLYSDEPQDYPLCIVRIERIFVKIGKCIYNISLADC